VCRYHSGPRNKRVNSKLFISKSCCEVKDSTIQDYSEKSISNIGPKNSLVDVSESEILPDDNTRTFQAIVVVVVNCRILRNKIPEFHLLIHSTKCNIIIGTESWLTVDDSDREIFPKSFTVCRKDRVDGAGGGVPVMNIPSSSPEKWVRVYVCNVRPVFLLTKYFILH
jgi:hypothetical protein